MSTLRMMKTALKNKEIDKRAPLTDAEAGATVETGEAGDAGNAGTGQPGTDDLGTDRERKESGAQSRIS